MIELHAIGVVESPLSERWQAPKQGDEGAPDAWLVFDAAVADGLTTRSPDRPNPIGLHRVRVLAVEGTRLRVADREALDGTPIVDVKPVLGEIDER